MLSAMAKSMFANPKAALGFAGITIAIAVGGSFAASSFLPETDKPGAVIVESEGEATEPTEAAPAQNVGWSDEGFADDWDDSAVETANGDSFANRSNNLADNIEPTFGDFDPQASASPSNEGENRSRSGSASGRGPRIESRAAPGAPSVRPPGGGSRGTLEAVD